MFYIISLIPSQQIRKAQNRNEAQQEGTKQVFLIQGGDDTNQTLIGFYVNKYVLFANWQSAQLAHFKPTGGADEKTMTSVCP